MKKIDRLIEFFMNEIGPFLIVSAGIFIGAGFGQVYSIADSSKNIFPTIFGGVVGFVMFGIIAREDWNSTHQKEENKNVIKRKSRE